MYGRKLETSEIANIAFFKPESLVEKKLQGVIVCLSLPTFFLHKKQYNSKTSEINTKTKTFRKH